MVIILDRPAEDIQIAGPANKVVKYARKKNIFDLSFRHFEILPDSL